MPADERIDYASNQSGRHHRHPGDIEGEASTWPRDCRRWRIRRHLRVTVRSEQLHEDPGSTSLMPANSASKHRRPVRVYRVVLQRSLGWDDSGAVAPVAARRRTAWHGGRTRGRGSAAVAGFIWVSSVRLARRGYRSPPCPLQRSRPTQTHSPRHRASHRIAQPTQSPRQRGTFAIAKAEHLTLQTRAGSRAT